MAGELHAAAMSKQYKELIRALEERAEKAEARANEQTGLRAGELNAMIGRMEERSERQRQHEADQNKMNRDFQTNLQKNNLEMQKEQRAFYAAIMDRGEMIYIRTCVSVMFICCLAVCLSLCLYVCLSVCAYQHCYISQLYVSVCGVLVFQ